MEKGHFGQYSGNARHSRTPVTKSNYRASVADDAAHIHYLKEDINYDAKHGHSDENMTADEKHISKLAGDMKYDKKHHSPFKQTDEREGKVVRPFVDPGAPKGFENSMGENYDDEKASRLFFDDVRKADKAVNIIQNVHDKGTSGFGYTTGGALDVLTGGPTEYSNYKTRIQNLRDKVNSDPRSVIQSIDRGISRSGSDAAMDVAKQIDPTGSYANASMYGQTRHYRKDAKQDPRFSSIKGRTKLEKK